MLRERCKARQQVVLRDADGTIAERLEKDRAAFIDLPAVPFDACDQRPGRVLSQALVCYRNNDYSVPVVLDRAVADGGVSTYAVAAIRLLLLTGWPRPL